MLLFPNGGSIIHMPLEVTPKRQKLLSISFHSNSIEPFHIKLFAKE